MHKIVGWDGQCHGPHSGRRETTQGQITKATCEGPLAFRLHVSKPQEPGVGWGVGKNGRKWKILELEVGGRLSPAPHPKAGGLALTRSVSEHQSLRPNPWDPARVGEAHIPPLGTHPKK